MPAREMDYRQISPQKLARECLRSPVVEAWQELIRRTTPVVGATIWRVSQRWGDTSPEAREDLAQDFYLKLCGDDKRLLEGLADSEGDAFFGLVKVAVANQVQDHYKGRHAQKRGAGKAHESLETAGDRLRAQGIGTARDIEWGILLQEIDAILRKSGFSERDQNVFRFYYTRGYAASEIAAIPGTGLTVKGVESLLLRMGRAVADKGKSAAGASS